MSKNNQESKRFRRIMSESHKDLKMAGIPGTSRIAARVVLSVAADPLEVFAGPLLRANEILETLWPTPKNIITFPTLDKD